MLSPTVRISEGQQLTVGVFCTREVEDVSAVMLFSKHNLVTTKSDINQE